MSGPWWVAGPAWVQRPPRERSPWVVFFLFDGVRIGRSSFFFWLLFFFGGNWHLRHENFKASIACRLLEPDRIPPPTPQFPLSYINPNPSSHQPASQSVSAVTAPPNHAPIFPSLPSSVSILKRPEPYVQADLHNTAPLFDQGRSTFDVVEERRKETSLLLPPSPITKLPTETPSVAIRGRQVR